MLRVSSNADKKDVDLSAIMGDGDGGVEGGAELTAFAEATVSGGDNAITSAREKLVRRLGPEATVDAAGVIGNFERMVRIADGTGIPLDKPMSMISADFREDVGIDEFASARNTPAVSSVERFLGRYLGHLLPVVLKFMARKGKRA